MCDRKAAPNVVYTQSEQTKEKGGGRTSSFRVRECILSVIQAGLPCVEKGGGGGGEKRQRGEEKTKQMNQVNM